MVGYWSSSFFVVLMDHDGVKVQINMQKRKQGQYPAVLTKQASKVNKALKYNVDFDKPASALGIFF